MILVEKGSYEEYKEARSYYCSQNQQDLDNIDKDEGGFPGSVLRGILRLLHHIKGVGLFLTGDKIQGGRAYVHIMEGVGNNGCLSRVFRVVGNGRHSVFKAGSLGKNDAGLRIQG